MQYKPYNSVTIDRESAFKQAYNCSSTYKITYSVSIPFNLCLCELYFLRAFDGLIYTNLNYPSPLKYICFCMTKFHRHSVDSKSHFSLLRLLLCLIKYNFKFYSVSHYLSSLS